VAGATVDAIDHGVDLAGQFVMQSGGETRTKSGAWFSRKGIPKDVTDEYAALHGPRWEELFHRPASFPLSKAKADHSDWVAKIESRMAAIRAKHRGQGYDLTPHQAHGLAGEKQRAARAIYNAVVLIPLWSARAARATRRRDTRYPAR
jgi:hypothetical protein